MKCPKTTNSSRPTFCGVLVFCFLAILPHCAIAATFSSLVQEVLGFLNVVVVMLIGIAVFLLVYGIVRYITAGGDPARLAEGGKIIMWGVISLFIMVSMWGLVNLLLNTLFPAGTGFQLSNQLFNVNSP